MASQRTSSGYNNAAYCHQYDYVQLSSYHSPSIMNHEHDTYMTSTAVDNCCYEQEDEIQLPAVTPRQLIREPPIGASMTIRITETRGDHMSRRSTTATRVSPKRNCHNGTATTSGSGHRNEVRVTPPRTPKQNVPVVALTPRTARTVISQSERREGNVTSRRQPDFAPRTSTSPAKPSVSRVRCVLTPQPNTAVIPPMYACANSPNASSPPLRQEPFSATGLVCRKSPTRIEASPGFKASWIHAPTPYQTPPTGTLATAGANLLLCGLVTVVLCFYMMSKSGRRYYLDFGILSGFGSVLLGCLGFRSRRWQWLPNRNYVSGYIVLSTFSLLTCIGLIAVLTLQPKPGEPLADVAGGAVCGIAVLSLILAAFGVLSSRCCKYPPPDNRVEHCAEGFTL